MSSLDPDLSDDIVSFAFGKLSPADFSQLLTAQVKRIH